MSTASMSTTPDLQKFWPRCETNLPTPWCPPLTMVAIGSLVAFETLDREAQVFRFQNWSGQIQIPIQPPVWVHEHFGGMIDDLHAGSLTLDTFRFHAGPAITEDQSFQVICEPHFSYVPCALSDSDKVSYKRLAWIQDGGLMPLVLYDIYDKAYNLRY